MSSQTWNEEIAVGSCASTGQGLLGERARRRRRAPSGMAMWLRARWSNRARASRDRRRDQRISGYPPGRRSRWSLRVAAAPLMVGALAAAGDAVGVAASAPAATHDAYVLRATARPEHTGHIPLQGNTGAPSAGATSTVFAGAPVAGKPPATASTAATSSSVQVGKGIYEPCSPYNSVQVFGDTEDPIPLPGWPWPCVAEITGQTNSVNLSTLQPNDYVSVLLNDVTDVTTAGSFTWTLSNADGIVLYSNTVTWPAPPAGEYWSWVYNVLVNPYSRTNYNQDGSYTIDAWDSASNILHVIPITITGTPESLYWGPDGAYYANQYWNTVNGQYVYEDQPADDCTDFTSQALAQGGLPWTPNVPLPPNDPSNASYWYGLTESEASSQDSNVYWSNSWTAVQWQYNYLLGAGVASTEGSYNYYETGYTPPDNPPDIGAGDLFYYNWDAETNGEGAQGLNHMTISIGTNQSGQDGTTGTEVDAHTTDRYDVFWSLAYVTNPGNAFVDTEAIFPVHLNGNTTS